MATGLIDTTALDATIPLSDCVEKPAEAHAAPALDAVAAEAYAIYESRGADHGRDLDDWLEAERRLGVSDAIEAR